MYFEACSAFYFDVSWLEERRITSPALATNNPHLAMPNLAAVSVNLQSHTTDLQELVALNSSYNVASNETKGTKNKQAPSFKFE